MLIENYFCDNYSEASLISEKHKKIDLKCVAINFIQNNVYLI